MKIKQFINYNNNNNKIMDRIRNKSRLRKILRYNNKKFNLRLIVLQIKKI